MLSTIIFRETDKPPGRIDPAEALVRTLSSLVSANIEGLLGDVAIAGPSGQGLQRIADQAGCALIEAATEAEWLSRAIAAARGPELFLLRSGFAVEAGFIGEADDFLRANASGGNGRPRAALLRAAPETFVERLFPGAAPTAGLIAPLEPCRQFFAARPLAAFTALARSLRPASTLRTRCRRIG